MITEDATLGAEIWPDDIDENLTDEQFLEFASNPDFWYLDESAKAVLTEHELSELLRDGGGFEGDFEDGEDMA